MKGLSPTHTRNDSDRLTLYIVIPIHNEKTTLPDILQRVLHVPRAKEALVVDDGSTDGTRELLNQISEDGVKVIRRDTDQGKGAATRTAMPYVQGQFLIIQDADLEYDPRDYLALIRALGSSDGGVVYGSKILNQANKASKYSAK